MQVNISITVDDRIISFFKCLLNKKYTMIILMFLIVGSSLIAYAAVIELNVFNDGDTIYADDVNENFLFLENRIAQLEIKLTEVNNLLTGVTREDNEITFSGVNVHIVNGLDLTNADVNSLGNLIVGYNEKIGSDDDRSGSHNIVLGKRHNYTSYGGLITGYQNSITGAYAVVSGGGNNTANGFASSVSAGRNNTASSDYSTVSGGRNNTASSDYSTVSGGQENEATEFYSTVSGGYYNTANGSYSTVSGGHYNTANGSYSSVNGGELNTTSGDYSTVSGGSNNTASGIVSTVSGGARNTASGSASSVSGGFRNKASGRSSSVSGGALNNAQDDFSQIAACNGCTTDAEYDFEAQGVE